MKQNNKFLEPSKNNHPKTATGPNPIALNTYMEDLDHNQQGTHQNKIPQFDVSNIEQQFDKLVSDIKKYEQQLANVTKNIEEVTSGEYFITDFYPQYIIESYYDQDQELKIINETDPQLGKILDNLQKSNRILKQQMKGWTNQFAKKTRLTQMLILENGLLRKYITQKNKDIVKLIQSINNTQNEDISTMKEQLNELKEQNGLLTFHLQKIKEEIKDKANEQRQLQEAYDRSKEKSILIKNKAFEAQQQEQHLSKQVTLLQEQKQEKQKKIKKLKKQKEILIKRKNQMTQDREALDKQLQSTEVDRKYIENNLKTKFTKKQSEKNNLMEQIEDLTENVKREKAQTRQLQRQILHYQQQLSQYYKQQKNNEKKIQTSNAMLQKLQLNLREVTDNQVKYASQVDIVTYETENLKEQINELKRKEQQLDENYKENLKQLQKSNKQQLEKQQNKLKQEQKDSSLKILQQRMQLNTSQRELEQWQRKVMHKKDDIANIKKQMKIIRQNQQKLIELKKNLRVSQKRQGFILS